MKRIIIAALAITFVLSTPALGFWRVGLYLNDWVMGEFDRPKIPDAPAMPGVPKSDAQKEVDRAVNEAWDKVRKARDEAIQTLIDENLRNELIKKAMDDLKKIDKPTDQCMDDNYMGIPIWGCGGMY